MFEKLKRKKNLSLGLTKNSRKYNIVHNGNLEMLDNIGYDSKRFAYLLRPIPTIEEIKNCGKNNTQKEVICESGQMINLISSVKQSHYSDRRYFHEKLISFQRLDDYGVSFYCPTVKDRDKYYHANEDTLKRYAIACTEKFSLTINSLTESITLDYRQLNRIFYSDGFELWEFMCNIIDIFENFEPLIVNQFAPGIIDTLKNFLAIIDMDTSYISKQEMIQEVRLYIKDVHKTITEFNTGDDTFPTPTELIEQKRIEEEESKRVEEERKQRERKLNQERQNAFLEKVRARRELLNDFNEPMKNVPLKLAKKNEELFSELMGKDA